jgi:hypothetical protein
LGLDSSFDEFKILVCEGIWWNLMEFDVNITWRMLGGGHPNCFAGVPISSDIGFNGMVGLNTVNWL